MFDTRLIELLDKFAGSKQFVYHFKPEEFSGKYILPLSELIEIDNKAYQWAMKKYQGRENWIKRQIPGLNCSATEIVNLSALNPIKLMALIQLLGIEKVDSKTIYKIPISSLNGSDLVSLEYDSKLQYKYQKLTTRSYRECMTVPADTVAYYAKCKKSGESPLVFEYVPHLLVRGRVDISQADTIKISQRKIEQLFKFLIS